jgi:hypothetical protein
MPSQSLGRNRGLGDLDAELEQLAMDLGAPHSGFSKLILYRAPLCRSAVGPERPSVCRLSFGSDIHSRMIFRRVSCSGFMLNPLL